MLERVADHPTLGQPNNPLKQLFANGPMDEQAYGVLARANGLLAGNHLTAGMGHQPELRHMGRMNPLNSAGRVATSTGLVM